MYETMTNDMKEANAIAECVLNAFDALPAHRKPRLPSSGLKPGRREWVPLAGIVLDSGPDVPPSKRLKCAALATGMKCLPQDKINSLQGNVLHDSHAEILALRAFNRFLLDHCSDLVAKGPSFKHGQDQAQAQDAIVEWRGGHGLDSPQVGQHATISPGQSTSGEGSLWQEQPFQISPHVKIHMYCSEAPCGDASMELTMAAQHDATPWSRNSTTQTSPGLGCASTTASAKHDGQHTSTELYGRSYFDVLGVVRRKPSRPDAPPTLSKSCSDKIALKQCTSILSSITSLLIHPANAYISTLIVPNSQYVNTACQRAWGSHGRMAPLLYGWDPQLRQAGYWYRPFKVKSTTHEFAFSRRNAATTEALSFVPSNLSTLIHGSSQETLINGTLQGRKQTDPKGASAVSRRKLWSLALSITTLLGERAICQALSQSTYADLKISSPLQARAETKSLVRQGPLSGWTRNTGDDDWSL